MTGGTATRMPTWPETARMSSNTGWCRGSGAWPTRVGTRLAVSVAAESRMSFRNRNLILGAHSKCADRVRSPAPRTLGLTASRLLPPHKRRVVGLCTGRRVLAVRFVVAPAGRGGPLRAAHVEAVPVLADSPAGRGRRLVAVRAHALARNQAPPAAGGRRDRRLQRAQLATIKYVRRRGGVFVHLV